MANASVERIPIVLRTGWKPALTGLGTDLADKRGALWIPNGLNSQVNV